MLVQNIPLGAIIKEVNTKEQGGGPRAGQFDGKVLAAAESDIKNLEGMTVKGYYVLQRSS